ncbi:hypothetical protein NXX56_29090 [Bacteroides thetaiotaomicron]|nr:hypothetical protein [Bacteroides thetaiotaomicron]
MQPQTAELDEVTVVAYGKQRKASVIGAINTVSMNEVEMPQWLIFEFRFGRTVGWYSCHAAFR